MSMPAELFAEEGEMFLHALTHFLSRFIRRLRRKRIRKMREQRRLSKSYRRHKAALAKRASA
jgi:hypothetical protein